jgi:hypothetical protein
MAENILTDEQVAELERRLLVTMPRQGPIGNGALRSKLGWDEDRYWYIRNRLLQAGILITGRGRGGSVLRVVPTGAPNEVKLSVAAPRVAETALYGPIISTIRSRWVPDHQIREFVVDRTAQQGRRDTGGKWSRPDIALASCNTYKFVPGKQIELSTFEIKTHDGLDVTAVYEALAHRRAAHRSYVLAYVPESERTILKALLDRLSADADEHGVGFVIVGNVADYETWDFEVKPSRNDPEPSDLDNFIRTQTSEEFQDKILIWCRTL